MKRIFLILTLFVISCSFSQTIDLETVKKEVINKNSSFYYEDLVKQFIEHPETFRADTVKSEYLYYGKLFSTYYKKSSEVKSQNMRLIKLTGDKKYSKAIALGENLIEKDPVNLVIIMNLINSYKNQNKDENKDKINKLSLQAEILLTAIAKYGDGKSKETAFKVIALGDEYILLNYLGINLAKYTRKSENSKTKEILDIWTKDNNFADDHREKIYTVVYSNVD
ncbi:DUF4919 domain-containing protein [Apibacter sp. HY039]|uniref:DUF4919 domain-containing protein n=1 Tax=Apibacter sp. HY039 TaxID=2501476 RepID=UPI000FEB5D20|nr:DUF4919 domain-containing protein [Apibacter sp. HY039]